MAHLGRKELEVEGKPIVAETGDVFSHPGIDHLLGPGREAVLWRVANAIASRTPRTERDALRL